MKDCLASHCEFRVLFDFSGSRGEPWIGNGFSNILAEAGHAVDKLLGTQLGYGSYALLGIVLAAVLLVCSFLWIRSGSALQQSFWRC